VSNHIDHIEITNFKSIRHQKIEGCKRVNVFIGYPNVGKSAILEAISALSYLQHNFELPFSELCRLKYPNELFYDGFIKEDIKITFNNDDINLKIKYISEKEIEILIEIFRSSWETYKKFNFSNNAIINSVDNSKRDKNEIIKIKKYLFQNEYYDYKTNGLSLFTPHGKNLVDIVQFNKPLRKEVIELFKSSGLKLSIDQGNNSIKALKQLDDETIYLIPFYQMADTLQRLIFHKAAIMSNEDTVLLFEEPEAHMFPPYIRKFTGDVIFDKGRGNQFFISTHSPFVVNDFLEDAREELSVFLVGLKDGETIIKRLSDEELAEVYEYGVDLFFNLESYLK